MTVEISYIINHSDSRLTFQSINKRLESRARCGSQKGASQPAHTYTRNAEQPPLQLSAIWRCLCAAVVVRRAMIMAMALHA